MSVYRRVWCNAGVIKDARSVDDMIQALRAGAERLRRMKEAGVTVEEGTDMADGHAILVTENPAVAERFDFLSPEEWEAAGDEEEEDAFDCEWLPF